jgi:phytoene dehydrogenase-like protein
MGWSHAEEVLAHPLPDGRAAVLSRDLDHTTAALDGPGAGDGAAWRRLYQLWQKVGPHLLDALFVPFPRGVPSCGWPRYCARPDCCGLALLPARKLTEEEFSGPGFAAAGRLAVRYTN